MWPFKRKIIKVIAQIETIICIPGFWKDLIEILPNTNGRFMVVGDIFMDVINRHHFKIELCDRDPRMRRSFEVAGMVTEVAEDFLDEIEKHTSVIYISSTTGNFKETYFITKAVSGILYAGGIGAKVETTGKAFEKNKWIALSNDCEEADLYKLYVLDSLMMEDGSTYSCGMHNLGLRDTIISNMEFAEAQSVVRTFNYYQFIDKPKILNGQTFKTDLNSLFYRITNELNQPNKGHDLFENPFGMWRLTKE